MVLWLPNCGYVTLESADSVALKTQCSLGVAKLPVETFDAHADGSLVVQMFREGGRMAMRCARAGEP